MGSFLGNSALALCGSPGLWDTATYDSFKVYTEHCVTCIHNLLGIRKLKKVRMKVYMMLNIFSCFTRKLAFIKPEHWRVTLQWFNIDLQDSTLDLWRCPFYLALDESHFYFACLIKLLIKTFFMSSSSTSKVCCNIIVFSNKHQHFWKYHNIADAYRGLLAWKLVGGKKNYTNEYLNN